MDSAKENVLKVAVTGEAAFVGYHTVKQLLEKGYHVRGTVLAFEENRHLETLTGTRLGTLEIMEADMTE